MISALRPPPSSAPDPQQGALAGRADRRRARPHRGVRAPYQRLRDTHRRARAGVGAACGGRTDEGRRFRFALRLARHHQGPDETAGIPTERGSHSLKGHVPTVSAPVIPRLEEAGAIILGKTTTSEFGWSGVSHCPLTGITRTRGRRATTRARLRRRRGRGGGRLRAAASGLGRRRLDPHAVPLQRHLRPEAELWPRAQLAGAQQRPGLPRRADDPHGG